MGGVTIQLFIDTRSGQPIYLQIYTQLKENIINGTLKADEPLPSIRNLAKDLRISVITTKRAYDELEKDGFIYTITGKGCFVAGQDISLLQEETLKKIESHMLEIARLARSCELSYTDIIEMYGDVHYNYGGKRI